VVTAFLIYPLVALAALFVVDLYLPMELVAFTASSPIIVAALSALTLVGVLAAAYRRKDNPVLMSAWLFLFCGLLVLTLGSLMDPFLSGSDAWVDELVAAAAFFPLLFFVALIASPMRLLMLTRRQRILYAVLGAAAVLAVFAVVFLPWLLAFEGPSTRASARHVLVLARPVLDAVLTVPLALAVLVLGFRRGGAPYLLVGIGLLLFIPEDIFEHFQLLREEQLRGMLPNLISLGSRLYLLNGAILGLLSREDHGGTP